MSFKCKIGFHSWDGCKCSNCEKMRDFFCNWSEDCEKCSKCGKTRQNQHVWNKCQCNKCSQTREESHDWNKDCEKCSICGKTRDKQHSWNRIDCVTCGKISIGYLKNSIGKKIESDFVKNLFDQFKIKPERSKSDDEHFTYTFKSKGLSFSVNLHDKKIERIAFNCQTNNQSQYHGELPYNISTSDNEFDINIKLGKPESYYHYAGISKSDWNSLGITILFADNKIEGILINSDYKE